MRKPMSADNGFPQIPEKRARLRDGRMIGYAEYGDPRGKPVFFFHGWPGSRLFIRSRHTTTAASGVRLIACDRPGFGLSDFQAERQLLNWPADVAEVSDELGIDQFAVAGHSGGGPYALACAHGLSTRITAAALISSIAPLDVPQVAAGMMGSNKLMFGLAKNAPWLHTLLLSLMVGGGIKGFMRAMASSLPEVDRTILAEQEKGEEDIAEAFRGGIKGPARDQYILARPWGFPLEGITTEIRLWQGDLDVMVPLQMGHYLAGALPRCHATYCPGEGHMLIFPRWAEILTGLTGG